MELYWTYISVLCISRHIAVKYLHYSRHRRGEFAKCPQSKNNKEQSISLSLPFYEMTWGRRWFYCWKVESPELSASFSESSKAAAFMKCILMLHLRRATEIFIFIFFLRKGKLSYRLLLINHSLVSLSAVCWRNTSKCLSCNYSIAHSVHNDEIFFYLFNLRPMWSISHLMTLFTVDTDRA